MDYQKTNGQTSLEYPHCFSPNACELVCVNLHEWVLKKSVNQLNLAGLCYKAIRTLSYTKLLAIIIEKRKKLTPFMRHNRTQRTMAQTRGSQFPRVPIVNVNGLNSQIITKLTEKFSGTPRSFKTLRIKYPTNKSAISKQA